MHSTIPSGGRFRRELLAPPGMFYQQEIGKLSRPSRNWAKALCPFHDDHHPSLSVNVSSGAFRCFSCNASGADIVAFVMLRDHVTFPQAARAFGAWEDANFRGDAKKVFAERRERERIKETQHAQMEAEHRRRLEARDWLHMLERLYRRANARLSDLRRRSAAPKYENEEEVLWGVLSDSLDLSRIAAVEYARLAGVGDGE